MAIVLTVPSQQYTPGLRTFTPNVAAGAKEFVINLARAAWPAGEVLQIEIQFPDGTSAGSAGFAGGTLLGRDGLPVTVSRIGVRATTAGQTLPGGQYTVRVNVLQTLTTTVTVERT